MSRIGKQPIPVPDGVKVSIESGCVEITGPKGNVRQEFPNVISVKFDEENKVVNVERPDDEKQSMAFHGLTRALIANGVKGVVENFKKILLIVGTGYNARLKGKHLELQIGFCLPQIMMIPEGLEVELTSPTRIVITGADKQLVGQFAANVRAIRPPDSYKGKGIRYDGEVVKIKAGKTFAGAG